MKVVAYNGSPWINGNTAQSLKIVLEELGNEGIETELVQLGGRKVFGCLACRKCIQNKNKQCARQDDEMNSIMEKMFSADGILIGSPTYNTIMQKGLDEAKADLSRPASEVFSELRRGL